MTDDEISINIVDTSFTERNKYIAQVEPKMKQTMNSLLEKFSQLPNRITDILLPVEGQSTSEPLRKTFIQPIPKSLDAILLQNKILYSTISSGLNIATITEIPKNVQLNTKIVSDDKSKCLGREFSCINDTSVRVCAPSSITHQFEEISQFVCSDNAPYCDDITGTCMSLLKTGIKSTSFTCLKNGYFPHPYNCSKYFLCINYKSYEFHCNKTDYYYNFKTNSCDPYQYDKHCNMFNCNGHNGFKIPYSRDSSIYAYCVENKPYVITKCEGKEKLNVTSQRCEPVCEYEGLIEDITDCTAYYKCVKTGLFYSKISRRCSSNKGFDRSSFQCVSLSLLPNCFTGKKS